jgi:hypothetical protein
MRKQNLTIGIFVAIIISVALLLRGATTHKPISTSTKCAKNCGEKPATSPHTGFFIFDGFSGGL